MRDTEDMEIDLLDLFGCVLKKWKLIVITGVVFGLIGMGYALLFGQKKATEVTDEEIELAVNELSVKDAKEVETLYSQHESYMDYKDTLQKYYSNYIMDDDEVRNYLIKTIRYHIYSRTPATLSLFTDGITPDVYAKIRTVLSDGNEATEVDVYKHVGFGYSGLGGTLMLNLGDQDEIMQDNAVLSFWIYARNQEQCSQIQQIVDIALRGQLDTVKKIDPNATLEFLSETYNDDVRSWMVSQRSNWFTQIQDVDKMIANVDSQVKAFSEEQTAYYELLEKKHAEDPVNPKGMSWKKMLVIFGLIGGILAVGYAVLVYLFDGKMKTEGEYLFCRVPVLNQITFRKGKECLFSKTIRKIRHAAEMERSECELMTASDLELLVKKQGVKNLYLLCVSDSKEETASAEKISGLLKASVPECSVRVGRPMENAEELKTFGNSDHVVLVSELKYAPRSRLFRYLDLCDRYQLPLLGGVTVEAL
ncbi:MAG: hypothetical protein IKS32_02930 [Solobacterium sp.]|nr:hypothetical protein [Solobacterium sp.]